MKRLRIAQLSPLIERVPPPGYGGTELVVSLLTEGLVEQGHEVTLFASGDSITKADLVSVYPQALRNSKQIEPYSWPAFDLKIMHELEKRVDEFDIVHNHLGYQALPFLATLNKPVLTTNHCIVTWWNKDIYLSHSNLPYVAISNAYQRLNLGDQLNYVKTIYHGIDTEQIWYDKNKKQDYLLFLGRLGYDKGTVAAINIAQAVNMPLIIAGKIDASDRDYFDENIKHLLDLPGVEYIGEVGPTDKTDLLQRAKALMHPIYFDEPFGLVMAESLAAGTPVLALNRGSVKELITDGKTGLVAEHPDQLIERFAELDNISRETCRQEAVSRFSYKTMVNNYLNLYEQLISKHGRINHNDHNRVLFTKPIKRSWQITLPRSKAN